MIRRIRQFFEDVATIKQAYIKLLANRENCTLPALMRYELGSIDLSNIPEPETGDKLKAKQGRIAALFKDILEPDIKRFIQEQLEFIGKQSANWDQDVFGRGTINGLSLLLEKWEADYQASIAESQPKPQFDPHKQFPE